MESKKKRNDEVQQTTEEDLYLWRPDLDPERIAKVNVTYEVVTIDN